MSDELLVVRELRAGYGAAVVLDGVGLVTRACLPTRL